MSVRRLLGAGLILALAATGCSGGDDDDDDRSGPTTTRYPPTVPVNNEQLSEGQGVCGFVNQGEVSAAAGSPVNAGSGVRTQTSELCRWTLRSSASQFVSLILDPTGREEYDRFRNAASRTAENLPGVGDQAFISNDTAYVLKGERLVILQVATSQPVATRKQAATRLVTSAAGKL
ncbi:MAG TPA: hypothetical protein VF045_08340 [Acidimicrobiales bacterium]